MPTLWTFGDSFTKGHGMNGEIPEYTNADENSTWVKLLANKLGYDIQNFGLNGLSNDMIMQSVISCLSKFEKDDVVIIESSTMGRMVVPEEDYRYNYAKVKPVFIHQNAILNEPKQYLKHFTESELESIVSFFNNFILDGFYYTNEVKALIDLVKYLNDKGIVRKAIYWNLFPIKGNKHLFIKEIYENESDLESVYLKNDNGTNTYEYGWITYFTLQKLTIFDDTNGKIDDKHLSKRGHDVFYRLLLNKLGLEIKHSYII